MSWSEPEPSGYSNLSTHYYMYVGWAHPVASSTKISRSFMSLVHLYGNVIWILSLVNQEVNLWWSILYKVK